MGSLAGKVALVSGGASGIGRAIAERFAAEGAMFVRLDVTQTSNWQDAIAGIAGAFGPLTTLVNNAGISIAGNIADTREDDWRRVQDVNAFGLFLGCQHGVRAMRESGGAIVNMASARGQRPSSGQLAYCASKALALNLTESVALYCGEQGLPIRCNAICPGVIETPLLRRQFDLLGGEENARKRLGGLQIMGRIGAAEEVAAAAAFLVSDDASFVTGAAFNVDGGFRIRDQ